MSRPGQHGLEAEGPVAIDAALKVQVAREVQAIPSRQVGQADGAVLERKGEGRQRVADVRQGECEARAADGDINPLKRVEGRRRATTPIGQQAEPRRFQSRAGQVVVELEFALKEKRGRIERGDVTRSKDLAQQGGDLVQKGAVGDQFGITGERQQERGFIGQEIDAQTAGLEFDGNPVEGDRLVQGQLESALSTMGVLVGERQRNGSVVLVHKPVDHFALPLDGAGGGHRLGGSGVEHLVPAPVRRVGKGDGDGHLGEAQLVVEQAGRAGVKIGR